MGWDAKSNTCEQQVICPAVVPSSCEMCQRAYPDCIGKHAKMCAKQFGWVEKGNSCPQEIICPAVVPTDCEGCKRLGPDCVRSHKKTCVKKFKWNQNDNSCPSVPVNPVEPVAPCNSPTDCSQCTTMDKKCLKKNKKACKGLGFDGRKCAEPVICPQIFPSTCEQCQSLGKECVGSHANHCASLGWSSKKNKCKGSSGSPTGTTTKCGKAKSCKDCAAMSADCQASVKFCKKKC